MKKFNHEDFDIETEIETGHDDFIYGNYVDWDRFRRENEDELIDYFDVYLPWGEELTIFEYADFITQEVFAHTSILKDWDLTNLQVTKHGESVSNIHVQFPNPDDSNSDNILSMIFDYYFQQKLRKNCVGKLTRKIIFLRNSLIKKPLSKTGLV